MNILRELRKFKTKSVIVKVRMLAIFAMMLIISAYAWFYIALEVNINNIRGKVVDWDVEYSVDDEVIKEFETTIAIEDFYPGMEEFEKEVIIRNMSRVNSDVKYELVSVKLFGNEILPDLQSTGNITTDEETNTTNIFSTEEYPFDAMFYFDNDFLEGQYVDDETTPNAIARLKFFANWSYEREGLTKTYEENDELDTYFGKEAYEYYESEKLKLAENEDQNEDQNIYSLEIKIRISTSREDWVEAEIDV